MQMEEKVRDENTEEMKVLEAQIEHLQAEVEELQRQQQENHKEITFQYRGQIQNALAYICGERQAGGKEMVLSRLKEEVEALEEDLKLQTEMNGITLNSCTTKTLQSSGRKLVQQLSLSGICSELVFQVEFQLCELKDRESSKRTISDLNVVLDSSELQNFSSFLSRIEESRDLLLFFRTLRTFSDRCDDRSRTFLHFQPIEVDGRSLKARLCWRFLPVKMEFFLPVVPRCFLQMFIKEKYPLVVSLPGGPRSEAMTLNHPELPGCMLFIHWSVEVSREGVVTPKINLLTKIPERALQLCPSQAVGGAAEAFQSLLRILGPEAALESIIRAVGLSQET